jgi:hypothetical protein
MFSGNLYKFVICVVLQDLWEKLVDGIVGTPIQSEKNVKKHFYFLFT